MEVLKLGLEKTLILAEDVEPNAIENMADSGAKHGRFGEGEWLFCG